MRSGVFISVLSHIALVALALLGTPRLFDDAAIRSIEAEIVRAEDAPPPPVLDTTPIAIPDMPPEPDTPIPYPAIVPKTQSPPPSQAKPSPQRQQPPKQEPAAKQASSGVQSAAPSKAAPSSPPPPSPTETPPSIFDAANIPALLELSNAATTGFDDASTTVANLSGAEKNALRAQLKKCWKLPASMSPTQTTRVVMRVFLKRDGALSADPILVEASASRDGPALVQAATRALKECAPYAFLPADKYGEWKILDLSFSPRDMAGG